MSFTITGGVNFAFPLGFLGAFGGLGGGGGGGGGGMSFTFAVSKGTAGGGGGAFAILGGGGGGGGGATAFFDWAINCAESNPAVASIIIFFIKNICWLRC
ncbi:MAG: hypothetical protein IPP72_11560 [Chitinophagaceae bacterium]|nr:hypothetical protein [Chitinophagaceae bacterium]